MEIIHFSAECYPVAKVGGLGDVVGALPKYQNKMKDVDAKVVMPWYNKSFVYDHDFEVVFDHDGGGLNKKMPISIYSSAFYTHKAGFDFIA